MRIIARVFDRHMNIPKYILSYAISVRLEKMCVVIGAQYVQSLSNAISNCNERHH